jgi:DNA-binding protein HU-beta
MTKQQLIEEVAVDTELGKADVEVALDSVLGLITEKLRSNERVDLRGFGSFVVKDRKERKGRNLRAGETITIAAKRVARFRPGKELTEKLAQCEIATSPEVAV